MGISLTPDQRDVIRDVVLTDLSVIGDIPLAIDHGEHDLARRYRAECEDLMALLDDLGWEDDHDGPVELTMAPERLVTVIGRLLDHQLAATADANTEWEADAAAAHFACGTLADLEAALGGPPTVHVR